MVEFVQLGEMERRGHESPVLRWVEWQLRFAAISQAQSWLMCEYEV